jgi:hypothetical protein
MALLLAGCAGEARREPGAGSAPSDSAGSATVPVVVEPTVLAFWLRGVDTLPADDRGQVESDFARAASAVAAYLADTDIRFVRTRSDTVVVQLAGGTQRTIMLSGLDYPYGFVLIDPGYAEEFHTGLDLLDELEAAIADYFGLDEDQPTPRPRHRIAALEPR